ncbi:MAG TPA: AI-2E family transporter [Prolixibacteraceae bacterium]|nr:AI-2E family transporter [Prolixibacteraceae bacterium]
MNISEQPFYFQATIKLLLFGLVIAFLILAKNILLPFTLAVFFTFLLMPVSRKLEHWRFPKILAILISIVFALTVFVALLYFFYSQILSFVNDLPLLEKTLTSKIDSIQQFISETFHVSRIEQKAWINTKIEENASTGGVIVLGLFSATTSFLASFALIPIYIFFLTLYQDKFKEFVRLITEDDKNEHTLMVVKKVSRVSQKYLVGIFLDVVILSILNSTGFLILGLPHAILFGVLTSLLNIIPYIGVLIGSTLPILMAFLTKDSMGYTLGVAAVCFVVQFLDNNFITPYVVGSSVSINPLTATLVLVGSSLIWGIPGMVLCMPLTGMAKVVCDHVESLKPYGYLLGEEVNFKEQEHIQDLVLKRFRKIKNS